MAGDVDRLTVGRALELGWSGVIVRHRLYRDVAVETGRATLVRTDCGSVRHDCHR
jgi:hypothetical protein